VPKVNKRRSNEGAADDDCGHNHGDEEEQGQAAAAAIAAANTLEDSLLTSSTDNKTPAAPTSVNGVALRMCPCCFAGPLLNDKCADMKRHHGECPRCSSKISNADAVIAAALATLGHGAKAATAATTVGQVLPSCPNPPCKGAKVLFNGCQVCGHLFAVDGRNEYDHTTHTLLS